MHPSGIIGLGDDGKNHLVQVARLFLLGRLPLGVNGGYDMVDVRDVAKGALAALQKGSRGECYILSSRYVTIREYLFYLARASGKRNTIYLPISFAKICYPFLLLCSKITGKRPLYTRYSLHTISNKVLFSHDKATRELGYSPRDIKETVYDMFFYLNGRLPQKKRKMQQRKEINAIV